jgi:hypothetical protein
VDERLLNIRPKNGGFERGNKFYYHPKIISASIKSAIIYIMLNEPIIKATITDSILSTF